MNLKKKWNIYLIHHSHTDIGYTERQEKLMRYHYDFIKQAIDILNKIYSGESERKGFVWQCENHWQIKNFYKYATKSEIQDFEKYAKSGEIGLSGNYLNMTELINFDILNTRISQAKEFGNKIGVTIKSGMSADINGFGWGYADALYENGVEHLFSCLHPHHGMFPLYKKQIPFYWESPKGNKILVWNGEHYHFGNELHFSPQSGTSYLIKDDITQQTPNNPLFISNSTNRDDQEYLVLTTRIERYLENMEEEGYPHDFIPIMVSGAITDNAPPNVHIMDRINRLNKEFDGQLHVQMVNLDQFFEVVKNTWKDIPTYKGDWNDWWADGVGSTPATVKLFRDAQRKYNICKKLDTNDEMRNSALVEEASEELMLYAEHTWGYSSSVTEPWETLVGDLELKKSSYAIVGNTKIATELDNILARKGEVTIEQFKLQHFKIINPHNIDLHTTALLYVEFWEYLEGLPFDLNVPLQVYDLETGEIYPSQVKQIARAIQIEVVVNIKQGEVKNVGLRIDRLKKQHTVKNHAHIGAEGIEDVILPNVFPINTSAIETDYYKVSFDDKKGICSIIDKSDNQELLRKEEMYGAFSGIYEVTDIKTGAAEERRRMGRNRKDISTRRYEGVLKDIQIVEKNTVFTAVKLDYDLVGTEFYSIFVKFYNKLPKIEAMVRVHKQSVWEPENLYIALPFTAGENETKYIDKTGCIIRPGIDQLPGTNQEFYLIQNGAVIEGKSKDIIISIKDAPLITLGDLKAKPITLCDGKNTKLNQEMLFSWVMNNYWETNFKVDLGGFFEFAYTITTSKKLPIEQATAICEMENEGLISCYAK